MQSGISASAELQDAFRSFTSSPEHFALPITITSEKLVPQSTLPFSTSGSSDKFYSSLPQLEAHLSPSTPVYLILRKGDGKLVAVTYIPSRAPVRSKTLFASTRATLVRELGTEKFDGGVVFATEPAEVLEKKEWEDRDRAAGGGGAEERDEALMTREERELGAVKRAEEEERFGTKGRDIGYGGGGNGGDGGGVTNSGQGRLFMNITDEARANLRDGLANGGDLVLIHIDVPTETFTLHSSHQSVHPTNFAEKIPSSQPSYAFYNHPDTSTILFAYTCPSGMPIKHRMLYASSRNGVLLVAKNEGVEIVKRIEAGAPDELDSERLSGEMKPAVDEERSSTPASSARQGFARPKRPGR